MSDRWSHHAPQVQVSLAANCPFLLLQVFDYDGPLTVDDFLGQVEIDLLKQRLDVCHASFQTLPLAAKLAGVRQTTGLGHLRVAVWVQASTSLLPPLPPGDAGHEAKSLQRASTASQSGMVATAPRVEQCMLCIVSGTTLCW